MLMRRTGKLLLDMVDDIIFNFDQKRIDIPIVKVERAAVDIGPRADIGHGDIGYRLFGYLLNLGVAQRVARIDHSAADFLFWHDAVPPDCCYSIRMNRKSQRCVEKKT